jgi:hypothetical protein
MAVPPFRDWPGADGILTANMWAWRFPTRPAFLGPVPLVLRPEDIMEIEEDDRENDYPYPRGLGQDFAQKPTPPPCSTGYIPVINRGVAMCIPGTPASSMMAPMSPLPQGRTFSVKAWYGWRQV